MIDFLIQNERYCFRILKQVTRATARFSAMISSKKVPMISLVTKTFFGWYLCNPLHHRPNMHTVSKQIRKCTAKPHHQEIKKKKNSDTLHDEHKVQFAATGEAQWTRRRRYLSFVNRQSRALTSLAVHSNCKNKSPGCLHIVTITKCQWGSFDKDLAGWPVWRFTVYFKKSVFQ